MKIKERLKDPESRKKIIIGAAQIVAGLALAYIGTDMAYKQGYRKGYHNGFNEVCNQIVDASANNGCCLINGNGEPYIFTAVKK